MSTENSDGIRELIISCDGIRDGIGAVQNLVERAPNLEGWKVVAFRQAVNQAVTIQLSGIKLSTDDILFDYADLQDGMVGLTLFVPGYSEERKDVYSQEALILLDFVIGEFAVMTKVRHIDITSLPKSVKSLRPLSLLKNVIE